MAKFRIIVRQYSADSNDRRYRVEEKRGQWPFRRWEYVSHHDTEDAAVAAIKRLVEYPRTVYAKYFYSDGVEYFDGGF